MRMYTENMLEPLVLTHGIILYSSISIKPLFHSYMGRFESCFPTFMFSFDIAASMVACYAVNKTCNKVITKKY